jgi:hypothetical protein
MDIFPLSAWMRLTQAMHVYFDTRPIVFSYEPGHGANLIEEAMQWCNIDLDEEIYDQDKIQEVAQEYVRYVALLALLLYFFKDCAYRCL